MTEIVVFEEKKFNAIQLFEEGGADPFIEELKKKIAEFEPDLTTEKGRKEIKSFAYKIAQAKTKLDDMGKDLTEEHRAVITKVNAERNRLKEIMQSLQDDVRRPVTEWEEAEKARLDEHKAELEMIEGFKAFANSQQFTAEEIQTAINGTEEHYNREWQEFKYKATQTKDDVLKALNEAKASREKYDAEQAELERLRKAEDERIQKEREEQIAREAAERAKREAEEKAAREKAEAEAKALAEKKAAEERERKIQEEKRLAEERAKAAEEREKQAAIESERMRKEAEHRVELQKKEAERAAKERAELAAKQERERIEAEQKRVAEENAKREADLKHRERIDNEAIREMVKYLNIDSTDAKLIIKAIANGKIPNVKVVY